MAQGTLQAPIRVLNVDDSDSARYVRRRLLTQAGFEVADASTGAEALRLAGEVQPQVILLDVRLPDLDGFEVCRRIRRGPRGEHVIIVHISAEAPEVPSQVAGLESGADAYLVEPVDPSVLMATLRALLRAHAAEERERRDIERLERSEQALRESEARLARTQEFSLVMALHIGRDGTWLKLPPTFVRFLGYDREDELLGRPSQEFTHPDDFRADWSQVQRLLRGEIKSFELEKRFLRKDGSVTWGYMNCSIVTDEQGRPVHLLAYVRDINAQRRAEEALHESEERHRALFESMQEAFVLGQIITDSAGNPADWRYLDVNPAFESMFGRGREGLLGRTYRELFPDGPWEYWVPALGAVALTGHSAHLDHFGSDKGRHYEAIAYSPRRGQFAAIFADVTERKQAEDALRESERHFRELADSMPQLVWITGANGEHAFFNRRWYEELGIGEEETSGERWAEVLHPDDRERTLAQWRRCLENGQPYQIEYRLRVANGQYRWFLGRALPIRDDQGRITRWYGTSTDIDDSKRAEEHLRQTQKLESVGLLAGGIAHDFNNLLTGIIGNASLVLDDRADPRTAARVREIMRAAERAANLTRQLLAYSGKGQFVVRDIDISQAIHDTADLVQFSIPKSVELTINVRRRLPAVRMDPGQLQQILMNLVINAGEAIGEGNPGKVAITTSLADVETPFIDAIGEEVVRGRYVSIEVSDTGSGIGKEHRHRIFDPFFTTKFTGRGLGLAAVAGILRTQKGAITVTSVPGRGSRFRVYLPVAGGDVQTAEPQPAAAGRATVLIVDDEATVRDVISAVLRREGYRVLTATDGRDALAACDRERGAINAAILDVIMPVMAANELIPELKARYPEIRILLTSGCSETDARRISAAYPGASFIQKPYTAQQIAHEVDELLR